jgi:hypothetical protein
MQGACFVPADLPSSNLAPRLYLKCQEKQDTTYHLRRRRHRHHNHHRRRNNNNNNNQHAQYWQKNNI